MQGGQVCESLLLSSFEKMAGRKSLMTIRLRGNIYHMDVVGPDGVQRPKSARTRDRKEALKKEREYRLELFAETPKVIENQVKFKDLLERVDQFEMAKPPEQRKSHEEFHRFVARTLERNFGRLGLEEIDDECINFFMKCRLEDVTAGTVRNDMAIFRKCFYFAIRKGLFKGTNPVKGVTLPKKTPPRNRNLDHKERIEYLNHLPLKVVLAYFVSVFTGIRRGELFRLQKCHLDFSRDEMKIWKSKSKKPRDIPIIPQVRGVLLNLCEGIGDSEFLFRTKLGKPYVGRNGFRDAHNIALRLSGVPDFKWHDIRHMFGRDFMELADDIYALKEIYGHYSVQQTEAYVQHSMAHKKRRMMEFSIGLSNRTTVKEKERQEGNNRKEENV